MQQAATNIEVGIIYTHVPSLYMYVLKLCSLQYGFMNIYPLSLYIAKWFQPWSSAGVIKLSYQLLRSTSNQYTAFWKSITSRKIDKYQHPSGPFRAWTLLERSHMPIVSNSESVESAIATHQFLFVHFLLGRFAGSQSKLPQLSLDSSVSSRVTGLWRRSIWCWRLWPKVLGEIGKWCPPVVVSW